MLFNCCITSLLQNSPYRVVLASTLNYWWYLFLLSGHVQMAHCESFEWWSSGKQDCRLPFSSCDFFWIGGSCAVLRFTHHRLSQVKLGSSKLGHMDFHFVWMETNWKRQKSNLKLIRSTTWKRGNLDVDFFEWTHPHNKALLDYRLTYQCIKTGHALPFCLDIPTRTLSIYCTYVSQKYAYSI